MSNLAFKQFYCTEELARNWWRDVPEMGYDIRSISSEGKPLVQLDVTPDFRGEAAWAICDRLSDKFVGFVECRIHLERPTISVTFSGGQKFNQSFEIFFDYLVSKGAEPFTVSVKPGLVSSIVNRTVKLLKNH